MTPVLAACALSLQAKPIPILNSFQEVLAGALTSGAVAVSWGTHSPGPDDRREDQQLERGGPLSTSSQQSCHLSSLHPGPPFFSPTLQTKKEQPQHTITSGAQAAEEAHALHALPLLTRMKMESAGMPISRASCRKASVRSSRSSGLLPGKGKGQAVSRVSSGKSLCGAPSSHTPAEPRQLQAQYKSYQPLLHYS